MTTESKNGISLRDIWDLQLEQLKRGEERDQRLGKLGERMNSLEHRFDRVEGRITDHIEVIRSAQLGYNGEVSAMRQSCTDRYKLCQAIDEQRKHKISELTRLAKSADDTGVHHLIEERTRWSTIKIVAAVLIGLLGAGASAAAIYRSINTSTPAAAASQPARIGAMRR